MILIIFIAVFKKYMKSYVIDRVWKFQRVTLIFKKLKVSLNTAVYVKRKQLRPRSPQ